MIRGEISKRLDHDPDFQWRGENVTRIENLSDIVFALSLGMIVSTSAPPSTFDQLSQHLLGIFPVAAAFAILLILWNAHFVYFRRYGLADGRTVFLNACLLLVVLFLAYPLRFIFDALFGAILMMFGSEELLMSKGFDGNASAIMMLYYVIGYASACFLIGALYANAYRKRDMLGLDKTEILLTKMSINSFRVQVCCAVLVGACAMWTPLGPFAGFLLFLSLPLTRFANAKHKKAVQNKRYIAT